PMILGVVQTPPLRVSGGIAALPSIDVVTLPTEPLTTLSLLLRTPITLPHHCVMAILAPGIKAELASRIPVELRKILLGPTNGADLGHWPKSTSHRSVVQYRSPSGAAVMP